MFREEKCFEFVFDERESSRVRDLLGEVVTDMGNSACHTAVYCYKTNTSGKLVIAITVNVAVVLSNRRTGVGQLPPYPQANHDTCNTRHSFSKRKELFDELEEVIIDYLISSSSSSSIP